MSDPGVRAAAVAVAIVLAAGAGAHFAGDRGVAFGLFALATLAGAAVCLGARSPARGALGLLASGAGSAGLFVLLAFDFGALSLFLIQAATALGLCAHCGGAGGSDERRLPRLAGALLAIGAAGAFAAWRCAGAPWTLSTGPAAAPAWTAKELGAAWSDPAGLLAAFAAAGLCGCTALVAATALARAGSAPEPGAGERA